MRPYFEQRPDRLTAEMTDMSAFPEHLHAEVEMLYVFSGQTTMLVGGVPYALDAGDLLVAFPGIIHGYGQSAGGRGIMVIFSPDAAPDYGALLLRRQPTNPVVRAADLPPDVAMCMREMAKETQGGQDKRVFRAYIQVVTARVMPMLTLAERDEDASDATYRALKYLSERFRDPVTLTSLAHALGVSESHLSHLFSRRLKTNFRAYVNTLRVDHAQLLLRSSALPVTHIAYECGFDTQRTFNRAFLEKCGVSPTQYRKEHGG